MGGADRADGQAPVVDRALLVAAVRRVVGAGPIAVVASAAVELPILACCTLLPEPLSWAGWGAAYVLASGAVVAAGTGPTRGLVGGLRAMAARRRDLLVAGALEAAGILSVTLPAIVLTLALGLGAFGAYLIAMAAIVSGSRLALGIPALVLRDVAPTDALELSWVLVEGVAVEVGALFAVVAAAALGPAAALALVAGGLAWPPIVATLASGAALALVGPLLPLVFAEALELLERRRRAVDPSFGRP